MNNSGSDSSIIGAACADQFEAGESNHENIRRRYPSPKVWVFLGFAGLLALEIRAAASRSFWFDEISTYLVATAPTLRQLLHFAATDGHPPLYAFLGRLCLYLPLRPELALRLPSIIAMELATAAAYIFVRRDSTPRFGLLSAAAFSATWYGAFYAVEGRPYALLLCWTGLALCCWQAAARGIHRTWALAGLAASASAAVLTHNYGIIYLVVPIVAGETIRLQKSRRIDWPVLGCIGIGLFTMLLTYPPVLHGQILLLDAIRHAPEFGWRPRVHDLIYYYYATPRLTLFLLLGVIAAALLFKKHQEFTTKPHAEDIAASLALALMLPALLVVTSLGTGLFYNRYGIGSGLGIAMFIGLVLSSANVRWPAISAAVPWAAASWVLMALITWASGGPAEVTQGCQGDRLLTTPPAGEALVMADGLRFSPTWWYSDFKTRSRLHYLSDLKEAAQHPDFVAEYSLTLEQAIGAPPVDDYSTFVATHRTFLLFTTGNPPLEWVRSRLLRDGFRLSAIAVRDLPRGVSEEGRETLYLVTAPEVASLASH